MLNSATIQGMSNWSKIIRGVALGDAWGDTLERLSYPTIVSRFGRTGMGLPDDVLVITDDTQMSLYLARALDGTENLTNVEIKNRVLNAWVDWESDPENFRAPGLTCLRAARLMKNGVNWQQATDPLSDGSGAVMRVWPAAFLDDSRWAGVAMWQAATTHGSPNGVVAAAVTAHMIRYGYPKGDALGELERLCADFSWVGAKQYPTS